MTFLRKLGCVLSCAFAATAGAADFPGVVRLCAAQWNCTPEEVSGRSRTARVVRARHLAMAVARETALPPYEDLGGFFRVDRGTVMHACRKMEKELRLHPDSRQAKLFRALCAQFSPDTAADTAAV